METELGSELAGAKVEVLSYASVSTLHPSFHLCLVNS